MVYWLSLLHNFIQLSLNSGSAQARDGEDLWQWSRLEIRLITYRRSTIPQKQFIIIIIIIIIKNESLAQVFSWEFYKICKNTFFAEHHRTTASYYTAVIIHRTTASCYTTSYCIAVSIVVKGELVNVNYDTKLKHMYQFKPEV